MFKNNNSTQGGNKKEQDAHRIYILYEKSQKEITHVTLVRKKLLTAFSKQTNN